MKSDSDREDSINFVLDISFLTVHWEWHTRDSFSKDYYRRQSDNPWEWNLHIQSTWRNSRRSCRSSHPCNWVSVQLPLHTSWWQHHSVPRHQPLDPSTVCLPNVCLIILCNSPWVHSTMLVAKNILPYSSIRDGCIRRCEIHQWRLWSTTHSRYVWVDSSSREKNASIGTQ